MRYIRYLAAGIAFIESVIGHGTLKNLGIISLASIQSLRVLQDKALGSSTFKVHEMLHTVLYTIQEMEIFINLDIQFLCSRFDSDLSTLSSPLFKVFQSDVAEKLLVIIQPLVRIIEAEWVLSANSQM